MERRKRYWLTIPLPDAATKARYEKAARKDNRNVAAWARLILDQAVGPKASKPADAVKSSRAA